MTNETKSIITTTASDILEHTEQTKDSIRQKIDGSLLSVCIAFLVGMVAMQPQKFDNSLNISLVAFSVAIPILGYGYLFSSYTVKATFAGWRLFAAIIAGAWIIESLGAIAVVVGVGSVILYLSLLAFKTAIIMMIVVMFLPFISMIALCIYYIIFIFWRSRSKTL